jgi:tryptophan synthase alpha chain
MSRIDTIFESLKSQGRKGLMPFLCGGFPKQGATEAAIRALDAAGASVIEVGIPFSDPIADGPVIAHAMHDAITRGATPRSVLAEVAAARPHVQAGLVAMMSISLIYRMSAQRSGPWSADGFIHAAKEAGLDGLIVPDAPLEESAALSAAATAAGLSYVQIISPTTPTPRIESLVKACTGFVYVLARVGITGVQNAMPNIGPLVARVRGFTALPIAVGFGVSTAEHVSKVVEHADAAIIGSALVKRMREADERGEDAAAAAGEFVKNLSSGLSRA